MPPTHSDDERISIFSALLVLRQYARLIVMATSVVVFVVLVNGIWHYATQSTRWMAWLEFRPTFAGADTGKYPNGLSFGPSDVTDGTVIDEVYDANHLTDLCSREDFRSSFVVEQASAALRFLDLEFQSKLADPRLSSVERQRLQEEYRAKRETISQQYRLTFIRPPACGGLAPQITSKFMTEVLQTWANDADTRRGVLKIRAQVLTPAIFDSAASGGDAPLLRGDLIRSALVRVITNIDAVQKLPGSELVRLANSRVSFAELRARFEDLGQGRLDPLVTDSGSGRESVQWAEQSLATATGTAVSAQQRKNDLLIALQEFSGTGQTTNRTPSAGADRPSAEGRSTVTQVDSALVDKIVQMSAANVAFRQELTRQFLVASSDAIKADSVVKHYQSLLQALNHRTATPISSADASKKIDGIVQEAKLYTKQFNDLYDEFSRMSLRPAGQMYHIEQPVQTDVIRSFDVQSYELFALISLLFTPIILAIGCLIHFYLWESLRSQTPSA